MANQMTTQAELVIDARAMLGEGARWDPARQRLYWLDILAGAVHVHNPADGSDRACEVGEPIACLAPRAKGTGVVAGLKSGIAFVDPDTGGVEPIVSPEPDRPANRFNDGGVDPAGRFWAGTITGTPGSRDAALYCLEPDLRARRVLEGVGISNGLAWSADARRMYYIDSVTRSLEQFDYDVETGAIANRREVVRFEGEVYPDGMTIDAEGLLWVALWGGGCVARCDPAAGRIVRRLALPADNVTSCAFGGPALDRLYITTAREGLDAGQLARQPLAGALFVAEPGVTGVELPAFAG